MSELYNSLKYIVDKINLVASKKIVTEKFFKTSNWVSPFTGIVTLYGVGKGHDAPAYEAGIQTVYPNGGLFAIEGNFNGAAFLEPTSATYQVEKGQSYEVYLAESDGGTPYSSSIKSEIVTSMSCVFNKEVVLGHLEKNIFPTTANSRRSVSDLPDSLIVGTSISVSQLNKCQYPLEPHDGENGKGIGGTGFEGKLNILEQRTGYFGDYWIIEIAEVTKQAGKGGTGFCEISYPYQGSPITIFDDIYA